MNKLQIANMIKAGLLVFVVLAVFTGIGYFIVPNAYLPIGMLLLFIVVMIAAIREDLKESKRKV